jgi:hypothetical protein
MKNLIIFNFLFLILFSCIKLEENSKKYSARKLQKMLEGTWEVIDYQIDGVSYLDTFFKRNITGNCHTYTFTQWKNSTSNKGDNYDTGWLQAHCTPKSFYGWGYFFTPREKILHLGGFYIIDSIYFFDSSPSFNVLKLEKNNLILEGEENGYKRRINFIKN